MLRGNNFHHKVTIGQSIAPQSVTSATVDGNAIAEPWNTHRQIAFFLQGGALAASEDGSFTFAGKKRADGLWETLKDKAGNDLILAGAKYDDTGALENGVLLGSFDLSRVNGETYSAIRVSFTEGGGGAALVAVAHVLFDAHEESTNQADELFALL